MFYFAYKFSAVLGKGVTQNSRQKFKGTQIFKERALRKNRYSCFFSDRRRKLSG